MTTEQIKPFNRIESYGIRGDQIMLTPEIVGFSGKVSPAAREHFNQPHGVALTAVDTQFGPAFLAYRPANESYHSRHDAVGITQVDNKLVLAIADGVSTLNLMGNEIPNPQSQLYSHHLVTHLKPFSDEKQAKSWLAGLPKVENSGSLGASTLKAMTIESLGEKGYQIFLAQLGDNKGILVGPTLVFLPNGNVKEIAMTTDTLPYLGNGHASPDFQHFNLPRGSIIAMASDGLSSEGFSALFRGEHHQFNQYCLAHLRNRMSKTQPYQVLSTIKDLVPNNRDDGTIAFLWLN